MNSAYQLDRYLLAREDSEYKAKHVEAVEPYPGGWSLTFDDGWSISCPSKHCDVPPQPGDGALLYGRGIGYPVRGIVLVDRDAVMAPPPVARVYRYETKKEHDRRSADERAAEEARREREFIAGRAEFDAKIAALPEPFQRRMQRFLAIPGWGPKFGGYELFCCTEAVKIARGLPQGMTVKEFHDLPSDKQRAAVPDVALDEHSGNTFGAACMLANFYTQHPNLLPKAHGTLHGLVGCEEYGCWAASEEAKAEAASRKEH